MNERPIITRREAIAAGAKRYYIGPCKHGHDVERLVSNCHCISCTRVSIDRWLASNRDHVKSYFAAYDAARREKKKIYNKGRSEKYRDRRKELQRARYAKNPKRYLEAVKKSQLRHIERHRERVNVKKRNRNAIKRAVGGRHTPSDIRRIFHSQSGKCAYCRVRLGSKRHVDHIIPLIRGGHNGAANLQILCASCNLRKADHDPIDFAQQIGRLL